jgi:hypothetical protein
MTTALHRSVNHRKNHYPEEETQANRALSRFKVESGASDSSSQEISYLVRTLSPSPSSVWLKSVSPRWHSQLQTFLVFLIHARGLFLQLHFSMFLLLFHWHMYCHDPDQSELLSFLSLLSIHCSHQIVLLVDILLPIIVGLLG